MRYLTQSELKTFRACRREWWLTYHRGLRLKETYVTPGAAYLGSVVHACLESDDLAQDWREVHGELLRVSEETLKDSPDKLKLAQEAFTHAEIIVDGYFNWLEDTGADQFLEPKAAEEKIKAPFIEGEVTLMGKLDRRVVHTETGQEIFVDYKTTGNLTDFPKQAPMDEQFLHYTTILRLKNPDAVMPSKGIWRMLTKSKRTDRTIKEDGSVSEFYGEHEYDFNEHQLASYMKRLNGIFSDITDVEVKLNNGDDHLEVVYPTPTRDCSWRCDFYGICRMFDDGSRVEDFVEDWYDERDPLERYQQDVIETEEPE